MSLWFAGLCDRLYHRIQLWHRNYDLGAVYATRPFMGVDGVKDVVTIRKHKIPIHPKEMEHLIRILRLLRPGQTLTRDVERAAAGLSQCRQLLNGYREVEMAFYQEDVRKLLEVLEEAKTGRKPVAETIQPGSGPLWS